jgi:hypothetical protein
MESVLKTAVSPSTLSVDAPLRVGSLVVSVEVLEDVDIPRLLSPVLPTPLEDLVVVVIDSEALVAVADSVVDSVVAVAEVASVAETDLVVLEEAEEEDVVPAGVSVTRVVVDSLLAETETALGRLVKVCLMPLLDLAAAEVAEVGTRVVDSRADSRAVTAEETVVETVVDSVGMEETEVTEVTAAETVTVVETEVIVAIEVIVSAEETVTVAEAVTGMVVTAVTVETGEETASVDETIEAMTTDTNVNVLTTTADTQAETVTGEGTRATNPSIGSSIHSCLSRSAASSSSQVGQRYSFIYLFSSSDLIISNSTINPLYSGISLLIHTYSFTLQFLFHKITAGLFA